MARFASVVVVLRHRRRARVPRAHEDRRQRPCRAVVPASLVPGLPDAEATPSGPAFLLPAGGILPAALLRTRMLRAGTQIRLIEVKGGAGFSAKSASRSGSH
ncbi:MAG: hypothetical protein KJ018_04700 [Burkholderiales bacterium]|nr:hypothetical protein [Burkholderiales bacterium]GIK88029.1 MAG: hypothetical protein BroJett026_35100 [Betaproteobacteria bacterium]